MVSDDYLWKEWIFILLCNFLNDRIIDSFLLFFWLRPVACLSSPTRDQTHTPYIGSAESQPLDHQGSPKFLNFLSFLEFFNINKI